MFDCVNVESKECIRNIGSWKQGHDSGNLGTFILDMFIYMIEPWEFIITLNKADKYIKDNKTRQGNLFVSVVRCQVIISEGCIFFPLSLFLSLSSYWSWNSCSEMCVFLHPSALQNSKDQSRGPGPPQTLLIFWQAMECNVVLPGRSVHLYMLTAHFIH